MVTLSFVLAMAIVMLAFMNNIRLLRQQSEVTQLARKYILKMETEGSLSGTDRSSLVSELEEQGLTEIDLSGTTFSTASYGQTIVLQIRGKLGGQYEIMEKRVSTAKN